MDETQDQRRPVQKPENKGQSTKPLDHLAAKRAQNLRDNLSRRKQQIRARQVDDPAKD